MGVGEVHLLARAKGLVVGSGPARPARPRPRQHLGAAPLADADRPHRAGRYPARPHELDHGRIHRLRRRRRPRQARPPAGRRRGHQLRWPHPSSPRPGDRPVGDDFGDAVRGAARARRDHRRHRAPSRRQDVLLDGYDATSTSPHAADRPQRLRGHFQPLSDAAKAADTLFLPTSSSSCSARCASSARLATSPRWIEGGQGPGSVQALVKILPRHDPLDPRQGGAGDRHHGRQRRTVRCHAVTPTLRLRGHPPHPGGELPEATPGPGSTDAHRDDQAFASHGFRCRRADRPPCRIMNG